MTPVSECGNKKLMFLWKLVEKFIQILTMVEITSHEYKNET